MTQSTRTGTPARPAAPATTALSSPLKNWAARWTWPRALLALLAAAGLGVDAYVHLDLAARYTPIATSTLSQADLFRAQAGLAIAAAVLLIVRPRRYTAGFAALVAASALAALLVYRYYDIGQLGPFPDMYEPVWFPEKTIAAVAEAAALAASLLLIIALRPRRR